MPSRRTVLRAAAAGLAAPFVLRAARALAAPAFGPPQPFDPDALVARAAALAAEPYRERPVRGAEILAKIGAEVHDRIRFRADGTVHMGPWPIQLAHPGRWFPRPVHVHVVEGAVAREVLYSPTLFELPPAAAMARELPPDLGFAGFRVMWPDLGHDWLSFLGASYFRASGTEDQYGLSGRGIAVDTGLPIPEEFPDFTGFWLAPDPADAKALLVHALLDGPSVAGAYRFRVHQEAGQLMDVEARLFFRRAVARLGVAPLTSMFWFGKHNRDEAIDWRPEVHDSDGLALWTGDGERIWRPLNDPPALAVSSFVDRDPRGFGLWQRERRFDRYQDDSLFYERRPGVWVEPLDKWGDGSVMLVEIPTDDEIHDNIAAFWAPRTPPAAGGALHLRYRLHWRSTEPFPPAVGTVVATRTGRSAVPGKARLPTWRRFVVDFAGGPLDGLAKADPVEARASASRGRIASAFAIQVVGTRTWRAVIDLEAEPGGPVDIRLYLGLGERTLTETWLYQHFPGRYA